MQLHTQEFNVDTNKYSLPMGALACYPAVMLVSQHVSAPVSGECQTLSVTTYWMLTRVGV